MPVNKQRKALKLLVENGGNMGIALKKAGYSDSIAKNPYKVIRSKGFQEALVEADISDEKLALALDEGLDAYKLISVQGQTYSIPNFSERLKYLKMAIKLKGYDKQDNLTSSVVFINNTPRPTSYNQ